MKVWYVLPLLLLACSSSREPDKPRTRVVELVSTLDGEVQPVLISEANGAAKRPLVVALHPWSGNHLMVFDWLVDMVREENYNLVHPNFRPGHTPKGCCSEYVIDDIDASIQFALDSMNANPDSIFVLGASGGGYATLCMALRTRHKVASFSAYVPISDLVKWYSHSDSLGLSYAPEILSCSGCDGALDSTKVMARSPLHWVGLGKPPAAPISIYAGINDGHDGPVPIDQSIDMYNALATWLGADGRQLVGPAARQMLLERRFVAEDPGKMLGEKQVILERQYKSLRLVIFDGSHEYIVPGLLKRLHPEK